MTSSPTAWFERVASTVLTVAAVAIAVALVRRDTLGSSANDPAAPVYVNHWDRVASVGRVFGSPDAPVKLVEFIDLQCPFCRAFNQGTLKRIRQQYAGKVSITYVHFLLPSHQYAVPAAIAADCAGEQGRFEEYVDAVLAKQDSLGKKAWSSFAADVGVPDGRRMGRCLESQSARPQSDSGTIAGQAIGVQGTPSVMVNGWLFNRPPSDTVLSEAVADLLRGDKPSTRRKWFGGR